jgi:hypothetical protein
LLQNFAGALIGLDEPVETWTWTFADFLDAILATASLERREEIVDFVLCEIDRRYRGAPRRETIQRTAVVTEKYLSKGYACQSRIAEMQPPRASLVRNSSRSSFFDQTFPHILIRHFAGLAWGCIVPILPTEQRQKLADGLTSLNVSLWPRAKEPHNYIGPHGSRPSEHLEPANPFHFDYDFAKYELDDLARIFGLPQWQVEDSCTVWVRKWSPDGVRDCPAEPIF